MLPRIQRYCKCITTNNNLSPHRYFLHHHNRSPHRYSLTSLRRHFASNTNAFQHVHMHKQRFMAAASTPTPAASMSTLNMKPTAAYINSDHEHEESVKYCYATLEKVSRSFAAVIQQLPAQIRDAICVFYLVLRGLDSIEDDMQHFEHLHEKCGLLDSFHTVLDEHTYSLRGIGDKHQYQELLENFTYVLTVYHSLSAQHQQVIKSITAKMAHGMKQFVIKQWNANNNGSDHDYHTRIESVSDYNEYCYYVAGIIGNGLSQIFSESALERKDFHVRNERTAVEMGLFLQKTNITRDYLEDIHEGRIFWPHEILSKYVQSAEYLKQYPNAKISKQCLNHMVFDAMKHLEHSLQYLSDIENPEIFRFCAIPQVMAIATLEKCYNNRDVFKKEVKISKPLALQIMRGCNNMHEVNEWFKHFLYRLNEKLDWLNDPNATNTNAIIVKVLPLL